MNIVQCLEHLGYRNDTDFIVQDDGDGQYLREWNHADPQPAPAELEAAWPAAQAALRKKDIERQLAGTDEGLARIVEDLIGLLVQRGFITEADLPEAARDKLAERRNLRTQL